MLVKRLATGLVLGPLFVLAILTLEPKYFNLLMMIILTLGAWEFSRLAKIIDSYKRLFFVVTVVLIALFFRYSIGNMSWFLYALVFWWTLNLYWVVSYPKHVDFWFGSMTRRLVNGVLLLVPMWLALVELRVDHGVEHVLLLLLIIWGADTGAYIIGRSFGKHKLAPNVSPGKSIEGALGGLVMGILVTLAFLYFQNIPSDKYWFYILLSLVVVLVSILGDLFESLYKRASDIKDSSNLLPGHGGILDRFDSLSAAAPFFLLGMW